MYEGQNHLAQDDPGALVTVTGLGSLECHFLTELKGAAKNSVGKETLREIKNVRKVFRIFL